MDTSKVVKNIKRVRRVDGDKGKEGSADSYPDIQAPKRDLQLIIPEKLPCFDLTPIGTAYHAYVKVQMFQDLSLLFA